jgi:UDP-N-acetylmuramoyl-tripeptide--D-alanyl-D-alanine ligase
MKRAMNDTRTAPEITIEAFQVPAICGGSWQGASQAARFSGAVCDSRQVRPGNLFVALRGERTDGHLYLKEAQKRGASLFLVERGHPGLASLAADSARIEVIDTGKALLALAAWHRGKFDIPFVAVTGANGKTTTKEMIAAVLGSRFETFKTPGNLNSGIGVPLSLLDLSDRHEVAVCELGMSSPGEIDRLGALVKPRCAVFTNIAPVHLTTLHTLEAVARAKFELLAHLSADGVAVFCADDPILRRRAQELGERSRTYGLDEQADLRGFDVRLEKDGVRFRVQGGLDVALPLFGRHNVYNALAALTVARIFGVESLEAVAALAVMEPAAHRSRIVHHGTLTLIDDVYNANPRATVSSLESLSGYPARARRVAVLGDMLELGPDERTWHAEVGRAAAAGAIDLLVCVGELAGHLAQGAREAGLPGSSVRCYRTAQECARDIAGWCRADDTVLLKGSRGAALESVLAAVLEHYDLPKEES